MIRAIFTLFNNIPNIFDGDWSRRWPPYLTPVPLHQSRLMIGRRCDGPSCRCLVVVLSGAASVNCLPRLSLLVADDKLVRLCHPHQLMHSATSRSSSSHSRARTHARIVRPFTYAAAHLSGRRVAAGVAPGYYVGSWSARFPVYPLNWLTKIPRFFLSRRPSVCLSVRIRSTISKDKKWPLPC